VVVVIVTPDTPSDTVVTGLRQYQYRSQDYTARAIYERRRFKEKAKDSFWPLSHRPKMKTTVAALRSLSGTPSTNTRNGAAMSEVLCYHRPSTSRLRYLVDHIADTKKVVLEYCYRSSQLNSGLYYGTVVSGSTWNTLYRKKIPLQYCTW
jgi:hypothetical protein